MEIGTKIKELRQRLNLTQEELAERSNLTKGFISQIERDLTSPSIDSLADILEALGTNFSNFFREEKEEKVVYKKQEYYISKDNILNNSITWCISSSQKYQMEPILLRLGVSGKSKSYHPFEGEEFGYILQGTVELQYGENKYRLEKGDSFYLQCKKTRQLENIGSNTAKVLWIENPPNF